MSRGRSVIVGGGLGAAGTLSIGGVLVVANTDPPTAQVASQATSSVTTFPRASFVILSNGVTIGGAGTNQEGGVFAGDQVEFTNQTTTTLGSVIIGNRAIARSTGGIVSQVVLIGHRASAINATAVSGATVIGYNATYTGLGTAILIGHGSSSATQNSVFISPGGTMGTTNSSSNSVGVGCSINIQGQRNTVIGDGAQVTGGNSDSVIIGQAATGTALRVVVIGVSASSGNNDCVVLGQGQTSFAANQFIVGDVSTVLIGKGNNSASPNDITYRTTNQTGTDKAGSNVIFQAGMGTSAGTPGAVRFSVGIVTGTGTTVQTPRVGVEVRFSSTALDTYLMVYDVDNATLERVSVGAADSGGAGFKVLRIPN